MKLQHVATDLVHQVWPSIVGMVDRANEFGGDDYTTDQMKVYLATGQWTLGVFVDDKNVIRGAVSLTFINYPNDRVAFITFIGGKNIFTEDLSEQLKVFAKNFGATKLQGAVRDSVAKLAKRLGYYKRYTTIEIRI